MDDATDDFYSPVVEATRIAEAASQPTPKPWPSWCTGHYRDDDDFDIETATGQWVRHHEAFCSSDLSVAVTERYHADGSVTDVPEVYNEAFLRDRTTSVEEVRAVATAMLAAADVLERLQRRSSP